MRRLREQQDVTLLVGATQLRCRVVAVNGDEAALKPSTAPRVSRQELEGAASLIFGHRAILVALKGRASWGVEEDDLRFTVRDGVQVPQQRSASRLRIPLDVTVLTPEGGRVQAHTIDVSSAGLSLAGGGFGERDAVVGLEIDVPDHDPPIACHGRIVRATIEMTAVHFTDLDGADRDRLARFIFAVQRLLASGELQAS
ncbi:MAG TPA: PilZ domain-containing protein [Solirubrobacteraceae bacterium]|nr:PilZ domain-containing protein [Solirubrobacteraceae bacterium]